jgi:hypothetical protein
MSIPDQFKCPVSQEIMVHPVVLSDGNTYDFRSVVSLKDLTDGFISPITREKLNPKFIVKNLSIHSMIHEWVEVNKHYAHYKDDIDDFFERKAIIEKIVKPCRCGSISHKRTNHKNCPLNRIYHYYEDPDGELMDEDPDDEYDFSDMPVMRVETSELDDDVEQKNIFVPTLNEEIATYVINAMDRFEIYKDINSDNIYTSDGVLIAMLDENDNIITWV